MRSTTRAIAALACASLMTACGGGGASPIASAPLTESASRTPDVAPDTTSKCTPKIYVGDYQNNDVLIYPGNVMNPGPCGKIKTGIDAPLGVAVDYDDGVYVANYLSDSSGGYPINEFLNGTKTPTVTIEADGPGYDLWVGKGRVLYVAEATRSAVAEYGYASTVPKATLAVNGEPYGVATDQKNNLYVSYLSNADGVGHVEEFAPGATTGTDAGFTVPLGGALRIDLQGNIIVGDRNDDLIDVFAPGGTTPGRSWSTPGRPFYLALNKAETNLYTGAFGAVYIYDYASGTQVGTITKDLGQAQGIATFPRQPY
jgi:hypothetical protein